jgi:transposase InsO family protein
VLQSSTKKKVLQGVLRGKTLRTTISDKAAPCLLDRVNRECRAPCPNRLLVSDFTYVSTWQGFVYVAFIINVFARYIVTDASTPPRGEV